MQVDETMQVHKHAHAQDRQQTDMGSTFVLSDLLLSSIGALSADLPKCPNQAGPSQHPTRSRQVVSVLQN